MNRNKVSVIFASIGIILVCSLMIVSTYAYFTVDVEGESEDITLKTFNDNTDIIYNDTSNVSMVNAYTGDEIVKTFSIENTSNYEIYYDILLKNVVNNFEYKDDLVYELYSLDGAIRTRSVLPSEEENIASNIIIKPHEKHSYEMKIVFLNTSRDQSDNMGKTFSSSIAIIPSKNINVGDKPYKDDTLISKIINESKRYTDDINEDGLYYFNTSMYGYPIYFYKGSNSLNNNVLINDICYKILRTDENYGIRLIYNGKYENNKCSDVKVLDEKTVFNTKSNYNAYVGYMYGDASSNNYKNEHKNVSSSTVKINVENWFHNTYNNVNIFSTSAIYCNNRRTSSYVLNGVLYSNSGYSNNNTGYISTINEYPTYDCYNKNDRFSVNNTNGNNNLTNPVGLITKDEYELSMLNNNSFLDSSDSYWTMTPAYFNGSDAFVYSINKKVLTPQKVNTESGIRPIITIDKDIKIIRGSGSEDDPYILR